ncbi:MAG: LysR family transcriptional regulator, partial [Myxococcales bacterium]|nr:LysR family transcriptional regulator [Myxococcales bacterium]
LDALEALEAIDRHGSFAAAARALHKVQSAVSYLIQQLEAQLGVQVFDRSGHRAVLTEVGRAVLEEARDVLARARRLEHLAQRFGGGWEPRLKIIVDGILPMEPLLGVFKQMADEGVPTRLQVTVAFLGGVQARFEADGADLMLVKDHTPGPDREAHALPPVRVLLVAAPGHPLAAAPTLTLADLQPHMELTVHDPALGPDQPNPHRLPTSRAFHLSDFNTKRLALLQGLGFGWMPHYLIAEDLAAGRLVPLAWQPGAEFVFTPHLVHPVARPLGLAGRRFLELLVQAG